MNRDSRQVLTELFVLHAQRGSERAFTGLHQVWHLDFLRFAIGKLGREEFARDVTQDTWVAIARGLRRLDDPACFPRWAFRILDRRCADWIRRRQTDRRRSDALEAEAELNNAADANANRESNEEITALREAISHLDSDARELLHLFYETGLSVNEIAEVLDVPAGTVKSRLFNTRESLRQKMERMKS